MKGGLAFVSACVLAALAPFAPRGSGVTPADAGFPGWPATWDSQPLHPRAATAAEAAFARHFPGRMAAFDDGRRHLLLRYVTQPTRRLHPASDCYRGAGYAVSPRPLRVDGEGRRWGCFAARRAASSLLVCESITGAGRRSWSDVSSWYWAALVEPSAGPWWAVTVAEAVRPDP
ncbi:MAG TPA: hypothetical protein VLL75_07940 [Vicinamibacteria bacterium]|nr:hypothetical protein [Vicinamibacteria bacterium]